MTFAALSDILVALTGIDQCTVDGPEWSFRADNPIFRRARLAAVDDARTRAEDYAAAFGAHLTSLIEIADVDDGGYSAEPPSALDVGPGRRTTCARAGAGRAGGDRADHRPIRHQ